MVEDQPPAWLRHQLGEYALDVCTCIGDGLNHGHQSRQAAQQQIPHATTFHGYGGPWPTMFDAVADRIMGLAVPGSYTYKPPRAPYRLAVVNDRLIWPFKHSSSLQDPITQATLASEIAFEVASTLIAAPPPLTLFDDDAEWHAPTVGGIDTGTTVLFAPYVCNAEAPAILATWIGEATVNPDHTLNWIHLEEIRTPNNGGGWHFNGLAPLNTDLTGPRHGFTEGELPDYNIEARVMRAETPSDNIEPSSDPSTADQDHD